MTEKNTRKQPRSKKADVHDMNFWELRLYIEMPVTRGAINYRHSRSASGF